MKEYPHFKQLVDKIEGEYIDHKDKFYTLVEDYIQKENIRPSVAVGLIGSALATHLKKKDIPEEGIKQACQWVTEHCLDNSTPFF